MNNSVPPGYKQTEVGVIPEDWEVKPLAGLATIIHGYGFQSRYFKPLGVYRLTTPGHFYEAGGFREIDDKQKFYYGPFPDGFLLSEGDLIVAMTEQADGLLGSAAFIPADGNYLHNQRLGRVKVLTSDVSSRFLYLVFNSKAYRSKVRETAAGTKVKHTSPTKLLEIQVAFPPTKAEQDSIAAALSDVDALISGLDRLIAKKRDIKQAALQQLLTGKQRLPEFSGEWEVKRLGEITDIDPENLGSDTRPDYSFQYISLEDVDCGTLRGHTEQIFCTAPSRARRKIRRGDVLVSTVRPNLKSHLLISADVVDTVCSTGFSVVRCKTMLASPEYIFAHLFGGSIEHQIETLITGSNYPAINSGDVKALQVPYPPLPEQTAIATVLSDMDAEITTLEARRYKSRAIKQGMMQELLTGRIRLLSEP
ncbi:MAG: restriction endonuclease subunit S [Desulfuromonadaceae bacterium]